MTMTRRTLDKAIDSAEKLIALEKRRIELLEQLVKGLKQQRAKL